VVQVRALPTIGKGPVAMKWSVDRQDRDASLQEQSCHAKDELIGLVPTAAVRQEHHWRPYFESRTPQHCRNSVAPLGDLQGLTAVAHQPVALSVPAHVTILGT
jgi:hypothetical protein